MTGGDDILYLITLRNLEIHLVIGLCCFEVCFGTGLKLACNGTHHLKAKADNCRSITFHAIAFIQP